MRLNPIAPAPASAAVSTAAGTPPAFRAPAAGEVAFMDLANGGFLSLRDALTGYGRPQGYDSLANARRAAYMLSVGAASPAAGVFQQGERFYVRALGGYVAQKPHDDHEARTFAASAAAGPLQLLHFEGNAKAHFGWVRDSRLVLLVDGGTRVWAKDAHHTPPKG